MIHLDPDGFYVVVNCREPACTRCTFHIFLDVNLQIAKRIADRQLFKCGHSCTQGCTLWKGVLTGALGTRSLYRLRIGTFMPHLSSTGPLRF